MTVSKLVEMIEIKTENTISASKETLQHLDLSFLELPAHTTLKLMEVLEVNKGIRFLSLAGNKLKTE